MNYRTYSSPFSQNQDTEDNTGAPGNKWNIESGHYFKATSHGFNIRSKKRLREAMAASYISGLQHKNLLKLLLYPNGLNTIFSSISNGGFSAFWSWSAAPVVKHFDHLKNLFDANNQPSESDEERLNDNDASVQYAAYGIRHHFSALANNVRNTIQQQCTKLKNSFQNCAEGGRSFLGDRYYNAASALAFAPVISGHSQEGMVKNLTYSNDSTNTLIRQHFSNTAEGQGSVAVRNAKGFTGQAEALGLNPADESFDPERQFVLTA